jgi:hypothetical protein
VIGIGQLLLQMFGDPRRFASAINNRMNEHRLAR